MSCATRLSFCGLTRSMRATAFASFSVSARSRAFLPMFAPLNPAMVPPAGAAAAAVPGAADAAPGATGPAARFALRSDEWP